MAAEEDGTLIQNMTVTPDHSHGTFDYIMETGGMFFADDHFSEEISEQYTEVPANVNYTRGGSLGEMGKHDLSNFSMVEHERHHMPHHHDHGNMSMGMMVDHDHEFDHVHESHAHAHGGNLSLGMMMDHDHEYDHAHGGRQLMMEIGILTSLVMLILALVILLVIPSNRKSYFNVVKLHYLVSVTFKYILLCILYFGGLPLYHSHHLCMLVGYLAHYFFIASFFWLSTMSFTVWNTFRQLKAAKREDKSELQRKVLLACGYSWGLPVLLSCATAIVQFANPSFMSVPDIGVFSCFLFNHTAKIVYDHVPTLLLLVANLYFFASTAWVLFYGFWAEKRADSVNQKRNPHRQRLLIVTFLFFISGTPWLLDVLNGFIAHNNHHLFFFIFDLINTFNGLFIFLLFIAKKDVLKGLQRLWRGSRDENGVKAMFSATSHVALTLSSSISSVSTVSINSQLSQTSDVSQL